MLLFHGMLVAVPIATCRPMGTLQWRGGLGGVNFVPSLGGPVCDSKELDYLCSLLRFLLETLNGIACPFVPPLPRLLCCWK